MEKLYPSDIVEESTHLGPTRYTKYANPDNSLMLRIDIFSPESSDDNRKWITVETEYEEVRQARIFNYQIMDVMKERLQSERFKRVTEMMTREYYGIWFRQ